MVKKYLSDEELKRIIPFSMKRRGPPPNRILHTPPRIKGACVEHGIEIKDGEELKLIFEEINSEWNQGVHLETDRTVQIDGKTYRHGSIIFYNPNHRELRIVARSKECILWVWNVWDFRSNEVTEPPGSIISGGNYCGMLVEELPNGYRYRCNEGRDDDDYDDLIFRIERTGEIKLPDRRRRKRGEEIKEESSRRS